MTHKNTMSGFSYVLYNAFWCVIAMMWYRPVVFIPLEGRTIGESQWILWALVLGLATLGILFTFKRSRNGGSVFFNVLLPYQIYAVISYWDYFRGRIVVTLCFALLLSVAFCGLVIFRKIKRGWIPAEVILARRLRRACAGARAIAILCLCTFLIPLWSNGVFGFGLIQAKDGDRVVTEEPEEWTISQNIDTVQKLKPENWKALNVKERLEVLSVIKNIEMRYLGINHEIYLTASNLEENTNGCYYSGERKIVISMSHLKDSEPDKVLHTLTHECYHAYSRQQIEVYHTVPDEYKNMLMFANAKVYEEEFADYKDGTEDYVAYAVQYCERHANSYADKAVEDYYSAIARHENKDTDE